jgi:putative membrane protein
MRYTPRFVLIGLLLAACSSDDDDHDNAATAIDDGNAMGNMLSDQIDADFSGMDTPSQIAVTGAIVITIDDGEIMQAQAALDRVSDSDVVAFANQMIADHTAHRDMTEMLINEAGVTPRESQVSATLRAEAASSLNELAAASDPDVTYMTIQVRMHEEARVVVGTLADDINDATFEAFLRDTEATIMAHRDHAASILRGL